MRILLIHQFFLEDDDPGGSRFNEMCKVWTEEGHQVVVLGGMMHYSGKYKRQEYKRKWVSVKRQGQVNVIRCYVSESYNNNFFGRLWGYFSFVLSSIWAGLFKAKGQFDVILVTSPPLFVGITAYILSIVKRIPFVFEVRDLWPESAIDTGVVSNKWVIKFAYWFESFIYKKAKLINVLTPAFKEVLVKQKAVPAKKVLFIPNAADFSLSDKVLNVFNSRQFKEELGYKDRFIITYVGAHGVANHLEQLIAVAEKLTGTNILFQLIGDGMQKENLKKQVESRGLSNVTFVDPVPKEEVFKYILASDMGTSVLKKVETFKTIYSNKTFDYMACKRPVLMLIDGVSRQLIEDAKCGYYAEPENTEEIVRVIREAMANKQALKIMGDNGYNFAMKHFDRRKLALKYLNELKRAK
ncbi:glycosyltransferase family 4 protein [Fulvivirga kasyanovii]|uniref:Glycosyltransferase WbuB n=1 Tax=Fulvivirga kasyanovii TaxID=396812 RepID=A0ABW9RKN3_9BACT|nr:glycosyltransferase family 4 protein [Fulvivirga kasyanovii]MTI24652.1 glycosyltransferase WbuB [Fulvivirga kasyanovii]